MKSWTEYGKSFPCALPLSARAHCVCVFSVYYDGKKMWSRLGNAFTPPKEFLDRRFSCNSTGIYPHDFHRSPEGYHFGWRSELLSYRAMRRNLTYIAFCLAFRWARQLPRHSVCGQDYQLASLAENHVSGNNTISHEFDLQLTRRLMYRFSTSLPVAQNPSRSVLLI